MTRVIRRLQRFARQSGRRTLDALVASLAGTITSVDTTEKVAALTFDDGPDPKHTPQLLDVLARHGAKATFFMLGTQAQQHPDIVERTTREGHAIGNHSWDHATFPTIDSRARRMQLEQCQRALGPHGLRMFRPPKGRQSLSSRFDVLLARYTVVAWNAGAEDWKDRSAEWMAQQLQVQLAPGCIICLHDALWDASWPGSRDRTRTIEAVDALLQTTASDYRYLTVPDLLRHGQPRRTNWIM